MKTRDILMKMNESELDGAFSDLYGKAPAGGADSHRESDRNGGRFAFVRGRGGGFFLGVT